MRSRWFGRLFGHPDGGGAGPGRQRARFPVGRPGGTGQSSQAQGLAAPRRSLRICLGIGDGSVHRQ